MNTTTNAIGIPQDTAPASATTTSATRLFTSDDVEKARKEEKDKLYPQLDRVKQEREAAQKRADELQKQLEEQARAANEARLKALPENERVLAKLQEIEAENQRMRQHMFEAQQEANRQVRFAQLSAYREHLLRQAGSEIIPSLVVGNSEDELERSVAMAKAEYQRVYNSARQAVGQQYQAQLEAVRAIGVPAVPPSTAPQYLPSPQPMMPQQQAYGYPQQYPYGFPAAPNAAPVTSAPPSAQLDLGNQEEAVRSGRYGKVREQLLNNIQQTGRPQSLGYSSLQQPQQQAYQPPAQPMYQPVPQAPVPGGATQPQVAPMMPPMAPQVPQAPMAPQQAAQPPSMVQQAQAAIARTMQGGNAFAENTFVNEANAVAARAGVNPDAIFAARFANTPPIEVK